MQAASLQAPGMVPGTPGAALDARDWGHLPPVAVQALGRHCCPASKAKLRLICRSWHDALANQFPDVWLGPGGAWAAGSGVAAVCRAFPAAARLHLISSSTRDYAGTHTQDLAHLLSSLPSLTHLSLLELHELEDFDNLDPASLWDALAAAAPALGPRLVSLAVSGCFWGCPELFGGLCELTSLTQLRLLNNPLETACEVNIIAGLSQLRVLEFGLIFDGSSQHHDVPRALEGISRLTLLEELSLPMWRRSLGGRAHPLAPSLAAALRQLTQLTSLAVDGKFGHLGVVSHLTKLRRLASAAPLSASGWEAISKLPALTLLTSLTPAGEALQVNPARPHSGLDLGLLASRSCLTGLDVAVMQPEHLATLGQFTQLQTLTLRAASTFLQERQQALLLTALSCLPAGLTNLTLGPLLPLSPQLLAAIAHSCPVLQSLQARFEAVALGATSAPGAAAAATAAAAGGLVPGVSPGGSIDAPTALPPGAAAAVAVAAAAGMAQGSEFGSEADTTASGQRPPSRCSFEAGPSSSSISSALRRLRLLRSLELVLLEQAAGSESEQDVPGGDTGWQQQWYRAASTRTSATGAAGMGPSVQLFMADLPPRLQQLVLAGPFQLCIGSSATARASRAASSRLAAVGPQQLQQQQQPGRSACSACGGTPAAVACQPSSSSAAAAVKLCECFSGIRLSSAAAAGRPPQPLGVLGAASGAAAAAGSAAAWDPAGHHSRLLSGLKRPGSYPSINAATGSNSASSGARAQSSEVAAGLLTGLPTGLPRPEQQSASGRPGQAVFVLEEPGCMEKRSRSCCSLPPAADASQQPVAAAGPGPEAAAAPAAAGSGGMSTEVAGASVQAEQQEQQQQQQQQRSEDDDGDEVDGMLVDDAAREAAAAPLPAGYPGEEIALELQQQQQAAKQQQEQRVPVLSELCLYKCQLSFCALQQLVASAGPGLSKLQLLRLRISPGAQQQQQQAAGRGSSGGGSAVALAELSAHQLQQLPVAWGTLQEWHLHPHHLWGLVMSGCFSSNKHRRSSSSSSFGSSDAAAEPTAPAIQQQQQLQRLQNVSQLLNLRRLSVVSRLPAGAAGACDAAGCDRPKAGDEPLTPLPLHSPPAVQQLLAQLQAGLQQLPSLRQLQLDLGHVVPEQPGLQDACGDMWAEAGEQLLEVLPACRVQHRAPLVWPAAGSVAAAPGEGSGAAAGAAEAGEDMLADGGAAIGSSSDDEFMLDYVI